MNTAPRRSLIAAALIACCASMLAGVDLTPPEVPNPYGTSEGRAIRDFLEETYKIKASDKLSLDELRALYRKTWNNEQEKRYLDEKVAHPADPAWVKAYTAERDQEQRLKWAGILEKMGVKAPADASVDQLRELAAKTKREQDETLEKKRLADIERAREAIAKQNAESAAAASAAAANKDSAASTGIRLAPIFSAKEILTDDAIRTYYRTATDLPSKSALERQRIEDGANGLIAKRNEFIKRYSAKAILTDSNGIEIWKGVGPTNDPEKENLYFMLLSPGNPSALLRSVELLFTASKRNEDRKMRPGTLPGNMDAMICVYYSGGWYYLDQGQTITIGDVVVE